MIIEGENNVSTYSLMVTTMVLLYFGTFSGVLAYATIEESRHRQPR
jgi:hypothetical protein